MKLNEQQNEAVEHLDGPCLCTAVPGSGKTRVIVERTARMIEKGVDPRSILSITFTNKAATEMKERVEKRIGVESTKKMVISTFHRLASTILRYHGKHLGYDASMSILDEDEQVDLMSQVARQLEYELTKPEVKKIVWNLNDWREKLETDDDLYDRYHDAGNDGHYDIAKEYLSRLIKSNSIDFSGMLSETVRLLKEFPHVLEAAQKRWKYFMVDEVQDTNLCQFTIVDLLCSHTKNVFIVGDADQSIYGWRGARMENLADFQKKYNAKIISLGKNYRSTPQIIKVSDTLIRHNNNRIDVEFSTDNPDGIPVQLKTFSGDREEADAIAKTIKSLIGSTSYTGKDMAVFYRLNSMSRAIEMAMISNGIPHSVIGNFSFYDRREIKDCLSMLRFLVNPKDGIAFHRIANKPKRSLGDTTVGKIELFAKNNDCDLMEAMKQMHLSNKAANDGVNEIISSFKVDHKSMSVAETLVTLLEKLRYREHIDEDPETAQERWDNIQELIKDAAEFSSKNGPQVAKYLDQIALMTSSDKEAEGDAVSLMSLHASKGLEFPVVFMLGVEQNILPHKRAVEERDDGIEEERRLCYVGFTRAKKVLIVSHCQRRQDGFAATKGKVSYKASQPSQFLHESGLMKKPKVETSPTGARRGYNQEQWDYRA